MHARICSKGLPFTLLNQVEELLARENYCFHS